MEATIAPHAGVGAVLAATARQSQESTDWRAGLPTLRGRGVTLRELRLSDAPSLFAFLASEEVARFISPPPPNIESFERFIRWAHAKRAAGEYLCFAVVPDGYDVAVGMFQIQMPADGEAEWGFALGSAFWGSGLFVESAQAVLDFAFGVMRLEIIGARAAVANGRGNGALRKVGAVPEHPLPNGLVRNGRVLDQYYWTITQADHQRNKVRRPPMVH
jgi:ribosomal-protein-alanine N-acetyltransferase